MKLIGPGLVAMLAARLMLISAQGATPDPTPEHEHAEIHLPAALLTVSGFGVVDAFDKKLSFHAPVCLISPPSETDRLFVVEKDGQIQVVDHLKDGPQKHLFLDINTIMAAHHAGKLAASSEWGLLGLAFHPKYKENGYFFVAYDFTIEENGKPVTFDRLSRFTVSDSDPNVANPDSELPLITQFDRAFNHNGGDIHFGPDGYLYYSMGDEGGGNDGFDNACFIDKNFFAAIYRLDVDKRPGNLVPNPQTQPSQTYPSAVNPGSYFVPKDNPFVGVKMHHNKPVNSESLRTEIFACGLRNAWRFSFDPESGRIFVGDVGQDMWEEVDIVAAGGDYGWSIREGMHEGPRIKGAPPDIPLIDPIYDYAHGSGTFNGNCIIGGIVYRGSQLKELSGQYLFTDFGSRRIWALREDNGKWTPSVVVNQGPSFSTFGVDPRDGETLMADFGGGRIYKLVRQGEVGPQPPALLSETGAFADLATLTPAKGVIPYSPNVAFWSDYAIKQRWFSMPNAAARIGFNENGNWTFPTGMVWVKNFQIETRRGDATSRRRLETRFLVKTDDGMYGITYKWRADQSDADLVPEGGADENIEVSSGGATHQQQHWHYPSRSECLTCHTPVAGYALGFNTPQLNGPREGQAQVENQLKQLSDGGYLSRPVENPCALPAYAKAEDTSKSLEWRVRSYLAVNCVQCHQPGGASQTSWDARASLPLESAHLINGSLVNNGGDPANRWAVPGDLAHSMILKRMSGDGVARMPPLATFEQDEADKKLISDWILQLHKQDK